MSEASINKLNRGAKFIIQKIFLDKIRKLILMELGILPKIQMQLLHSNRFGSAIIKCNGIKYAIDNSIAKKLLVFEVTNI